MTLALLQVREMEAVEMENGITWFYPEQPNRFAITLSASEALSVNQALMPQVSGQLLFGFHKDNKTIHIKSVDSGGFLLPKSGLVRSWKLVQAIIGSGVLPPARFAMTEHAIGWIGHLCEQRPKKFSPKRKPKVPSTKDMLALELEEEALCKQKISKKKR